MFVDSVKIQVKAGDGGRGCNSIYRDKYTREGVPDGGGGGNGADIIIRTDRNLQTLLDFKYKRQFIGAHGQHGSGNDKRGRDAAPVIIRVPVGTVVKDANTGLVLRDLSLPNQDLIVAKGGKGGLGNHHRHEASPGEITQSRELTLELKLIADVGLVGFPNAGKSTLICAISRANSKIGAYHFTTKSPVLGVVNFKDKNFIVADIPGLIQGSSEGRGLGDQFLRHVERTRILVHIIDMSGVEGRDPLDDYKIINAELKSYNKQLGKKPQIVVANKMDLPSSRENLASFKKKLKKKVYPISALQKDGLEEFLEAISKQL
ncbi:MAG: GTPase ObgE [Candidatus Omnitrophica bacterium]|jgi:GTP-binding protein|nr:GTPase ObgE [Candidatus Omnitrophota bacterium]